MSGNVIQQPRQSGAIGFWVATATLAMSLALFFSWMQYKSPGTDRSLDSSPPAFANPPVRELRLLEAKVVSRSKEIVGDSPESTGQTFEIVRARPSLSPSSSSRATTVLGGAYDPVLSAVSEQPDVVDGVTQPEPVLELILAAMPNPVPESGNEDIAGSLVGFSDQTVSELGGETITDRGTEPVAELIPEAVIETIAALAEEAMTEPVAELAEEAMTEPVAELAEEAMTEPVAELAKDAETEPFAELAEEVMTEPVAELAKEAETEPVAELNKDTGPEPVAELDKDAETETVAELAKESVAEIVAEPDMKSMTKPDTQTVTGEWVAMRMEPLAESVSAVVLETLLKPAKDPNLESLTSQVLVEKAYEPVDIDFLNSDTVVNEPEERQQLAFLQSQQLDANAGELFAGESSPELKRDPDLLTELDAIRSLLDDARIIDTRYYEKTTQPRPRNRVETLDLLKVKSAEIRFAVGSKDISDQMELVLSDIFDILSDYDDTQIAVHVTTHESDDSKLDLRLSQERGRAIIARGVSQGIDFSRFFLDALTGEGTADMSHSIIVKALPSSTSGNP